MPPDPPRPLTPLAARRAWAEPTVRPWWLMAAAVLLAVAAYAVGRGVVRSGENRLITAGTPVVTKVLGTPDHTVPGQAVKVGETVTLAFDWHGQPRTVVGTLAHDATVAGPMAIRVDPADPTVWTDATEPTPLARSLVVGLVVLPVVPLLLLVAVWRRAGVARTYTLGRLADAVVADRRQTPVAPLSFAVRCSLREGGDRRLRTVYVPRAGRSLAKGDVIAVLVPTGRGRIVSALWFE